MRIHLTIDDIDPLPIELPLSKRSYADLYHKLDRIVGSIPAQPALRIAGELAQKCAGFDRMVNEQEDPRPDAGDALDGIADCTFGEQQMEPRPKASDASAPMFGGWSKGPTQADATAIADGWIPWAGGECPVAAGAEFQVRYREGAESSRTRSTNLRWNHGGRGGDIIAYRLSKPEAPKADAEGWIEWHGGECPVPPKTAVEVKFRAPRSYELPRTGLTADGYSWEGFVNGDGQIVAYRVIQSA